MARIKNIAFDFGGVLIEWNQRYFYRDFFKDDERMEYFLTNVYTAKYIERTDRGETYDEVLPDMIAEHPDFREAIEIFPLRWGIMLHDEKPEGVALFHELKSMGYHLYGLTNWSAENIGEAFRRFDFLNELEGTVVSGIERTVKPEPEIYNILLNRYSLCAEETLFIDDKAANVEAAKALGMAGVVFGDIKKVRAELSSLLGRDMTEEH